MGVIVRSDILERRAKAVGAVTFWKKQLFELALQSGSVLLIWYKEAVFSFIVLFLESQGA